MNKKMIIILVGAAFVSFGGAFTVTWFVKKSAPNLQQEVANQDQGKNSESNGSPEFTIAENPITGPKSDIEHSMSEKKLEALIYDMIERKKEYKYKKSELEELESRIRTATNNLQADTIRLNSLREQIENSIATLQQQQAYLDKSVFEISQLEQVNFQRIATRYDAIKPKQAAQILINMNRNRQLDDIVKIIYYMGERQSAKLLGEISTTEPTLVAVVTDKLKRIKERK